MAPNRKTKRKRDTKNDNASVAAAVDGSGSAGEAEERQSGDEYDFDSSDEEDVRNTIGNVPMDWYRDYAHIGYDLDGAPILKPAQGDSIDEFLRKHDDPNYWRTVKDESTGQDVLVTDQQFDMIQASRKGKYASDGAGKDEYEPWVDLYSHEVMETALTGHPPQKRQFIPSKWEKIRVSRYLHSIKMGWMKPVPPRKDPYDLEADEDEDEPCYDLWKDDNNAEISKRHRHRIPAPKPPLPGYAVSYRPPPEFLLSKEEEEEWKNQDADERKLNFLPRSYNAIYRVPQYAKHIEEPYRRLLDLYLCPRQIKMKANVRPEDLLPKLPNPNDLKPFPCVQSLTYRGHTGAVTCVSVSRDGRWMVSGSMDGTMRLWEVSTAWCALKVNLKGKVKDIAWNPKYNIIAAAVENAVVIINPQHMSGDVLDQSNADKFIDLYSEEQSHNASPATWTAEEMGTARYNQGFRLHVQNKGSVKQLTWHTNGDFLACVVAESSSKSNVITHQVSKRRSQMPFKEPKGITQSVLFHHTLPFMFVASQRFVRVYDLVKKVQTKKLVTNCKWVSSMALHPSGDHVLVGSYDSKLSWFDMDLSSKPYRTLRHHKQAVRSVAFHKHYPLFASASIDGTVHVCHSKVSNDFNEDAQLVLVKQLRASGSGSSPAMLAVTFHPHQPWLLAAAEDNTIRLFRD